MHPDTSCSVQRRGSERERTVVVFQNHNLAVARCCQRIGRLIEDQPIARVNGEKVVRLHVRLASEPIPVEVSRLGIVHWPAGPTAA